MKGLIFNLLEEFVSERFGEEVFEDIVAAAGKMEADPHGMVGPGSYADQDFTVLVDGAARRLGLTAAGLLHDFGRYAVHSIARRYPQFFTAHRHPRDFLASMGFIHSLEVKKLYHGAEPPRFDYVVLDGGGMKITYRSSRRLCPFFAGLLEGTGDYYKIALTQSHESCTLAGDDSCVFVLAFGEASGGDR